MKITKHSSLSFAIKLGKRCLRCGHCCRHGSGFVLKNEVKDIAKHSMMDEKEFIRKYLKKTVMFNTAVYKFRTKSSKKPYGECVMLDGDRCSIQDVKPLHCRIGNCSEDGEGLSVWFYLNYLVNPTDPESIRQWKLYIDSGGKVIPGGELRELVPDKKMLKKIINYEVLK